jgi:hypothetical protein
VTARRPFLLLVLIILVCNLADWALTWDVVQGGYGTELNPLGRLMLAQGPAASLLWKLGLVAACCAFLYLMRDRAYARAGLWLCAGVYVGIVCWQVVGRLIVF